MKLQPFLVELLIELGDHFLDAGAGYRPSKAGDLATHQGQAFALPVGE